MFLIIFGIKIEYYEMVKLVDIVKFFIVGGFYLSKFILEILIL